MHSFVWWILVGAVAGILAKAVMPGDRSEPRGCIMTILLGIAGSLAMGFVVHDVLHSNRLGGFWDSVFGAVIGALVLIWIGRLVSKSS